MAKRLGRPFLLMVSRRLTFAALSLVRPSRQFNLRLKELWLSIWKAVGAFQKSKSTI